MTFVKTRQHQRRSRSCATALLLYGVLHRVLYGVLSVMLPAVPLQAQSAPLDLAGALRIARQRAPGVLVAEARRDIAIGTVRELTQMPNPTIEWRRENLGSSLQPDIFATLYVPVDLTGRRLALRTVTSAGTQRARRDALVERREAEVQVVRTWLRAASANGALAVAQQQLGALSEIARVDSLREREGFAAGAVALRTSLESDRASVQMAIAAGELGRARADLARALGVADQELPAIAMLAAPPMPAPPESAQVRELVLRTRPEIAAREAQVRETDARYTAERRGVMGDVQLQGGSKQTSGFLTGQVGIAMPFPLFNRNAGARQRAAGELAQARALRDDALIAVRASVAASWHAYMSLRASAAKASTFDRRGREIAQIARVAYTEGHITLLELLDAERAASDATTAHLRWAAEAWLARVELERALGARLDGDSPLDLPLLSTLSHGS